MLAKIHRMWLDFSCNYQPMANYVDFDVRTRSAKLTRRVRSSIADGTFITLRSTGGMFVFPDSKDKCHTVRRLLRCAWNSASGSRAEFNMHIRPNTVTPTPVYFTVNVNDAEPVIGLAPPVVALIVTV